MAAAFSFTSYGEIAVIDNLNGGINLYGNGYRQANYENLPVAGTGIRAISPAQVFQTPFGTVTANSIIEVYPTGLALPAKTRRFICDTLAATLATNRG